MTWFGIAVLMIIAGIIAEILNKRFERPEIEARAERKRLHDEANAKLKSLSDGHQAP